MTKFSTGHGLVLVQFVASGALVLSAQIDEENGLRLVPGCVGIGLGVWSIMKIGARRVTLRPDVRPETQLVTAGPYRMIRHPMYTALLLFAGGFVFTPLEPWKAIAWLVLLCALIVKSRIEEQQLNEAFPEYAAYQNRSWRFVPYLW